MYKCSVCKSDTKYDEFSTMKISLQYAKAILSMMSSQTIKTWSVLIARKNIMRTATILTMYRLIQMY
jgi:hypothetical protein